MLAVADGELPLAVKGDPEVFTLAFAEYRPGADGRQELPVLVERALGVHVGSDEEMIGVDVRVVVARREYQLDVSTGYLEVEPRHPGEEVEPFETGAAVRGRDDEEIAWKEIKIVQKYTNDCAF